MIENPNHARKRGIVWYPADFSGGQVIAQLPDDLEPRLLPPGGTLVGGTDDEPAVLLLDDPDAALIDAARQALVPVVVLSDDSQTVGRGCVSLATPVSPATLA